MGSVGIDWGFLKCRDGIFKLIEFVMCLVILIVTSASDYTTRYAENGNILPTGQMAYVNFVASFGAITLLISVIIYFFKLYNVIGCKSLPWKRLEIIYALVSAVMNFISMAVAGHSADNSSSVFFPSLHSLFATGAVFSALLMIMFGVHALLIFRGDPPRSQAQQSEPSNVAT